MMTPVRPFRCRAILFDLDGVLVDSSERVEKTWREWATRHRLNPEHVIGRLEILEVPESAGHALDYRRPTGSPVSADRFRRRHRFS
jgi:beta-phosphoglucomutase-like phosphatase (HAD superfamily)